MYTRALCVLTSGYPGRHSLQRLTIYDYLVVHSDDIPGGPVGLQAEGETSTSYERMKGKVNEELKAARTKANEIIDQAHQRANQLIDAAKADAITEGNRQKALAEAEIESAANRAKEELRKQVSVLAVSGAEKLLKREIDASAHKALIDDLAAQL